MIVCRQDPGGLKTSTLTETRPSERKELEVNVMGGRPTSFISPGFCNLGLILSEGGCLNELTSIEAREGRKCRLKGWLKVRPIVYLALWYDFITKRQQRDIVESEGLITSVIETTTNERVTRIRSSRNVSTFRSKMISLLPHKSYGRQGVPA